MCCSVLQCVAVRCGVRLCYSAFGGNCKPASCRCAAVCCCVLLCVAVCCSVLQCAAVCCCVLLCASVCCHYKPASCRCLCGVPLFLSVTSLCVCFYFSVSACVFVCLLVFWCVSFFLCASAWACVSAYVCVCVCVYSIMQGRTDTHCSTLQLTAAHCSTPA